MFLMSNSLVLCGTYMFFSQSRFPSTFPSRDSYSAISIAKKRRRFPGLVGNVKNDKSRKRTWWEKFFFDDDENWLGLKEDVWEEGLSGEEGGEVPEGERFEAWKRRVEAISELQEAQDEMRTSESRDWEDWLGEVSSGVDNSSSDRDWDIGLENGGGGVPDNPSELDTGFVGAAKDLVFRNDDDELLYEDKVFRYASNSTAKFLALLVLIPWALDFLVHDYVLMPFLDRLKFQAVWEIWRIGLRLDTFFSQTYVWTPFPPRRTSGHLFLQDVRLRSKDLNSQAGGLGLRKIRDMNRALLAKWVWHFGLEDGTYGCM